MFRTFNMGIGFVLVLPEAAAEKATAVLVGAGEHVVRLGEITTGVTGPGASRVTLEGVQ